MTVPGRSLLLLEGSVTWEALIVRSLQGHNLRLEVAHTPGERAALEQRLSTGVDDFAALIVAPGSEQIPQAHALVRVGANAPIVLLVPPEEADAARRRVQFDPLLGAHARVLPAEPDKLGEWLDDIATKALQRRQHEATIERINRALSPPAQPVKDRLGVSASYLASALEQSPDGIFFGDQSGSIVAWNTAAERLLGWTTEGPVVLWDTATDVRELLATVRLATAPVRRELERLSQPGPASPPERRTLEVTFARALDEAGEFLGFSGIARDVTDRRRQEAEARGRAEFEQQLIGIVSHDLRNPVAAILMTVATMLRQGEELGDKTLRSVTRIQSSAERASRMIRDLLDLTQSRLGGGIKIERRRLDLGEVVRCAVQEVESAFPERTLRVESTADGRGEWDGDRLTQVVTNLTTNALRHGRPDGAVEVRLRNDADGVSLSVHNEGVPIPLEKQGELFEPMKRATAQVDTAGRSIGLGLYIVKEIVKAHGGRVSVHSTVADGTTFTVWLPRTHPTALKDPSGTTR